MRERQGPRKCIFLLVSNEKAEDKYGRFDGLWRMRLGDVFGWEDGWGWVDPVREDDGVSSEY